MNDLLNKIHTSDIMSFLPKLPDNSIDVIIIDPPYFLDKMDNNWDDGKVSSKKCLQTIQSLPADMKYYEEKPQTATIFFIVAENVLRTTIKFY